jgi:predicted patatin/cPLA2 family phospholipase
MDIKDIDEKENIDINKILDESVIDLEKQLEKENHITNYANITYFENKDENTDKNKEQFTDNEETGNQTLENIENIENIENKDEKEEYINEPLTSYDTLTIAGGSTKGLMILGALQYAYDNYLLNEVKNYIGTSCGAMIGYLLAIGYTPIEIIVYICSHRLMEKMMHFNIVGMINSQGATSFSNIHENLEKMTIEKVGFYPTLKDLKDKFDKTLVCVTYNITENKTEYLSYENYPNLPCLTAIRMSSNLPLIFENYKYGNCYYVDGGISDNFAIDIGDQIGKKVLGILLHSTDSNFSNENDVNILEFIYKLMFIPISQILEYKLKNISDKCKIITLSNNKLKFFNFDINSKEKLDLFSTGYEQMKEQMET